MVESPIFCTVVNCMDGRVQAAAIEFLKQRFQADVVDTITEAGPNAILAHWPESARARSIAHRVGISLEAHGSIGIAIGGHHDCAGNPGDRDKQNADTRDAVRYLRRLFPGVEVIGLYFGPDWQAEEIDA